MNQQWNAVVLAGDRGAGDPVASAAGVEGKAFAKLEGVTLLERVIAELGKSNSVNKIITVGPKKCYLENHPQIQSCFKQHHVQHIEPASGPSASAIEGSLASDYCPTLIVTCDLALLTAEIIDEYCHKMIKTQADFAACAIDYQTIHKKIPQLKKTEYKFAGQSVCFANIFAMLSPQGLKALEYWQEVEKSRKKPIQLIRKIDWMSLLNYKLGRLRLEQVAMKLSAKVGANLEFESMGFPELAIDVDSAEDYEIMKKYLLSQQ